MNNRTGYFLAFAVGVAVGVAATFHYAEKKYRQLAQEEIDSVKEVYSAQMAESDILDEVTYVSDFSEEPFTTTNIDTFKECVAPYDPTMIFANQEKRWYVIPPSEFGEQDGYLKVSLTYYADGVLADENDEEVEDVATTIGIESLSHFGEYEDDSVYVRNDIRRCDYEILLDHRTYSEVRKHMPHSLRREDNDAG